MEGTSQGLNHGFLDRPKEGGCPCQITARKPQGVLKLLGMEDPVKGVFSSEFIGAGHIDADLRLISTESGPDFSSTFAEGDGRTAICSQQKMRPPERATGHLNGESRSGGGWRAFPRRTFPRHQMIPEAGDQAVLVPGPVRPASFEGFGGTGPTGQGGAKDRSPSMNESYGLDGYSLAFLGHIHSHLFQKLPSLQALRTQAEPSADAHYEPA